MCEFISHLENKKTGTVKFLTADDIFKSRRGKELQRFNPVKEDWVGHGAILWFFSLDRKDWLQKECTDFSTPDNFPKEIVTAIKAGKMAINGLAFPIGILGAPLYADYEAKRDALDADYKAKRVALYAAYEAKRDALDADYKAKRDALDAAYKAKRVALYADYEAKRVALDADYEAKRAPLDAGYKAKRVALYAAMWKLFELPENRSPLWR